MKELNALNKLGAGLCAVAICLASALALAEDAGIILGAEDDLTVSGTQGTSADADLEVKGYAVFGASGDGASVVTQGVGGVFVAGHIEVASNLYVAGGSELAVVR